MEVLIQPDRATLARTAAELIASQDGPFTLGLAGGSTPADTYDELHNIDLDWSQVSLWLSDERWVAPDDPESNGRMALDHLPAAAANRLIRPRYSDYLTPADSAVHYDAALRRIHGDDRPDLVLLGMGTDGHTASLFPGTDALEAEPHRWFVANHVPALDTWRLTVTPSLLRSARRVVVLVSGTAKAQVLAEVLDGPDGVYPIQILRHAEGEVTVICDAEAAAVLSR
ncbi:MAG: 6-phosphogluconolactonase [Acidimicrobiia bacterium]